MGNDQILDSKHFTQKSLAKGVYACIHKPGGAAFSNAGIIDLGDQTLVVDALHTRQAGFILRQFAEALFKRPVDTIILTHGHHDHWIGACAFEASTTILASRRVQQYCLEWGPLIMEDFQNSSLWEEMLVRTERQFKVEQDPRLMAGHEHMISFFNYIIAERTEFQPRLPDRTFEDTLTFQGRDQIVELRSLGRGHSEEDSVLLLPKVGIAFIGDIGFFDTQPYLGICDFDIYRQQLQFFLESDFHILVPGHGPVGGKIDLELQLKYMDVMEELVSKVVHEGGSIVEALHIVLPEPFDSWLMGGMERFDFNVRTLFKRFGGEISEES